MAQQDLDRLLKILPSLTAQEKAQAAAKLKVLQQFDSPAENPGPRTDIDEDLVLDAIHTVLTNRGVDYTPVGVMRRSRNFTPFRRKVPSVMEFIRKAAMARPDQMLILCKGLGSLYDHLFQFCPVSHVTLMRNIHSLPAMINRSYPGYAECGLLSMIVKAKKAHGNGRTHNSHPTGLSQPSRL